MYPTLLRVLTGLTSLLTCAVLTAHSTTPATDSLLAALPAAQTPFERERLYVQLADLSADSLSLAAAYWERALAEADKAGDNYGCMDALDILVREFSGKDTTRALGYVRLADSLLPERQFALFRSSLYSYYVWKQMSDNNSLEAVDEELSRLKARKGMLTPEEQIVWEFLTGLSVDYASIATEAYGNIWMAIPYVERALKNLGKYPLEERLHFEKICRNELGDLYMFTDDKRAAREIETCIDLHRKWLAMDTRFERPHRDTTGYLMHAYGKMVFLRDLISKEKATEYYQKCMQFARERNDRSQSYDASARYYQYMGDYQRAIAYIDSTLTLYKQTGEKVDLSPIYASQSYLYEEVGDYKNALKAMREANSLRYKSRVQDAQSSLTEMQTLFNVNQLELEKAQLADRNKFFILIAAAVLLLLLAGWSTYQYVMVRRLKRIRQQLLAANEEASLQGLRAMESEKMKTAFINSICHEIRTPLNAISGFSQLLLGENLDDRTRDELREEIWTNTTALTTQLENMLQLSDLISTETPLPLADTDICLLCAECLSLQRERADSPAVQYLLEGSSEGTCIIPTNAIYLTRVIDNLLHNAAKFTAEGYITLAYTDDKLHRTLHISVSDTGIGIAPEKQEWVFERFAKVDTFQPGTGIGLYLCRLIVTRLGGEIRVCPEYRDGCRILIELPY